MSEDVLVKFQEFTPNMDNPEEPELIVLSPTIYNQIMRPMVITGFNDEGVGSSTEIEKEIILCDGCNDDNPEYVLTDGEYLYRTVCEVCRKKYYGKYRVIRGDEIDL